MTDLPIDQEEHVYVPLPRQAEAHAARARYILFGGAVGPGKSRWMVEHIRRQMLRWPGIPVLLGRYQLKHLKGTTETLWQRFVDNRLWDPRYGGSHRGDVYTFPNGSALTLTGYRNGYEDWMSGEFGLLAFDECDQIPEDVITNLDTRLRWTTGQGVCKFPECRAFEDRDHPEHPFYQELMACNPNPRWPKRRFYDRAAAGTLPKDHAFIQTLTSDNPNLPPDYIGTLTANNNPTWVRRMLAGDWTAFEGAVFDTFTRDTHTWDREEQFGHLITEVWGGIDWGATTKYAHPTAAVLVARLRDGTLLQFWEYRKQGAASKDFFEKIAMMNKIWNVRGWYADSSQGRAIEALNEYASIGTLKPANRNPGAVPAGINLMSRLFEPQGLTVKPKLVILETCEYTISEIETYEHVPESEALRGLGRIEEEPVPRNDDCVTALRYVVTGMNASHPVIVNIEMGAKATGTMQNKRVSGIMAARRQEKQARLEAALQKTGGIDA